MKSILSIRAIALLLSVAPNLAFGQLLEYRFNDTGSSSASTGSNTTPLTMYGENKAITDLHGAPGSGVSGRPEDLAFNNSGAGRMGIGTGVSGGVANAGPTDALDNLVSFTIQGWFKATIEGGGAARLVEKFQSGTTDHYLSLQLTRNLAGQGQFSIRIGGAANTVTTNLIPLLGTTNEWVFFAVTYDSSKASDQISFYVGSTQENVQNIGSMTLNAGVLPTNTGNLVFGNPGDQTRPFAGYLDNFRIYGSTSDSSGALSINALENLRNVDAIPEPGSALLLLGGAAFSLGSLAAKYRTHL